MINQLYKSKYLLLDDNAPIYKVEAIDNIKNFVDLIEINGKFKISVTMEMIHRDFVPYHEKGTSAVNRWGVNNEGRLTPRVSYVEEEGTIKNCNHVYIDYVGFTDLYKYCKLCGAKE